jgi:hypothetical protein
VIGMENQPSTCSSLPQSTSIAFSNVAIQWANSTVPNTCSGQVGPGTAAPCGVKASCNNSAVQFEWDSKHQSYSHEEL